MSCVRRGRTADPGPDRASLRLEDYKKSSVFPSKSFPYAHVTEIDAAVTVDLESNVTVAANGQVECSPVELKSFSVSYQLDFSANLSVTVSDTQHYSKTVTIVTLPPFYIDVVGVTVSLAATFDVNLNARLSTPLEVGVVFVKSVSRTFQWNGSSHFNDIPSTGGPDPPVKASVPAHLAIVSLDGTVSVTLIPTVVFKFALPVESIKLTVALGATLDNAITYAGDSTSQLPALPSSPMVSQGCLQTHSTEMSFALQLALRELKVDLPFDLPSADLLKDFPQLAKLDASAQLYTLCLAGVQPAAPNVTVVLYVVVWIQGYSKATFVSADYQSALATTLGVSPSMVTVLSMSDSGTSQAGTGSGSAASCPHCDTNAACIGSQCHCNAGFTGNGSSCSAQSSGGGQSDQCFFCDPNAACVNGNCVCKPGFNDVYGDGSDCSESNNAFSCFDCSPNATCSAKNGTCTCNAGYTDFFGDGSVCLASSSGGNGGGASSGCLNCDPNATCDNSDEMCKCNPGFYDIFGDGSFCSLVPWRSLNAAPAAQAAVIKSSRYVLRIWCERYLISSKLSFSVQAE